MNWLSRLFLAWRDRPDPAWKPTGLKFTTGRDYDQEQGVRMARESRKQSASGRVYRRPSLAAKSSAKKPAPVVEIRRLG